MSVRRIFSLLLEIGVPVAQSIAESVTGQRLTNEQVAAEFKRLSENPPTAARRPADWPTDSNG